MWAKHTLEVLAAQLTGSSAQSSQLGHVILSLAAWSACKINFMNAPGRYPGAGIECWPEEVRQQQMPSGDAPLPTWVADTVEE